MSLNWNATHVIDMRAIGIVPDGEEATQQDKIEWAKTEHIIFASMVTGLGKSWALKATDVDEVFDRLSAYEHVVDSPVQWMAEDDKLEQLWLTPEDVRKRIGLTVNVSQPTRAAFERRLGQIALEHAKDRRRYADLDAKAKAKA